LKAGITLSGLGYSLVYAGLGVEAIRCAPEPWSRDGCLYYTVCLDLSLGLASPALGLIAGGTGLGSVYLASTLVVPSSALISLRFMYAPAQAVSQSSFQRQEIAHEPLGRDDFISFTDCDAIGSLTGDKSHERIKADADV
jgi:hypothetical protein